MDKYTEVQMTEFKMAAVPLLLLEWDLRNLRQLIFCWTECILQRTQCASMKQISEHCICVTK